MVSHSEQQSDSSADRQLIIEPPSLTTKHSSVIVCGKEWWLLPELGTLGLISREIPYS